MHWPPTDPPQHVPSSPARAPIHATCPPTDMSWLPHHASRACGGILSVEDVEGVKNVEEIVKVPVRLMG